MLHGPNFMRCYSTKIATFKLAREPTTFANSCVCVKPNITATALYLQPSWSVVTFIPARAAGHDRPPVLAAPQDLGLGVALGLARQVDQVLLPHHQVIGAVAVHDGGGHCNQIGR